MKFLKMITLVSLVLLMTSPTYAQSKDHTIFLNAFINLCTNQKFIFSNIKGKYDATIVHTYDNKEGSGIVLGLKHFPYHLGFKEGHLNTGNFVACSLTGSLKDTNEFAHFLSTRINLSDIIYASRGNGLTEMFLAVKVNNKDATKAYIIIQSIDETEAITKHGNIIVTYLRVENCCMSNEVLAFKDKILPMFLAETSHN